VLAINLKNKKNGVTSLFYEALKLREGVLPSTPVATRTGCFASFDRLFLRVMVTCFKENM
jgi:hypothetical protein